MFSSKVIRALASCRRFVHVNHAENAKRMVDEWDMLTGLELFEAREYAKGNIDPFHALPIKRGPGTKDCPIVIPSYLEKRIVGCLCHHETNHVVYFYLFEGFPRRCDCNFWFVLERLKEPKIYEGCEE